LPWCDPVAAFHCFARDDAVVFFHSGGAAGPRSQYSYLCVEPFELLRDATLQDLAARLRLWRRDWPGAPVPFIGGAAGFFGYDAPASWESGMRPPGAYAGVPDMQFGLYDLVFAWDHVARRCWLLSALGEQGARLDAVLARLREGAAEAAVPALQWRALVPRTLHLARVEQALDYIRAGDIYQANITAGFAAALPEGAAAADMFVALSRGNPAPFSAFIGCGSGAAVASVSPERFISVDRQGAIETRPIKGTRPRGATPYDDAAQASALLASAKDRAENLMIVDLLRNDLSRVARLGSVTVPALAELESFASVHHLVSAIAARLRPDCGATDLLAAALPGGSITGAPKIRAMHIIAELEGAVRGPYCGTAAWLGFDGAMDSNILIRTVTVTRDLVVAQAGGGIVADSDPAAEWDELMVKVTPLLRALGDVPA
jgi:para-aminobenzoate synthetase component 1